MSKLSKPNVGLEEARPFAGMNQVHPNAAGVDIGAYEIMVCDNGTEATQIVRSFGSYTIDLQIIGTWLAEHGVETVAMESIGVYIGFRYLKNWSAKVFIATSLVRGPCGEVPDVRVMWWTASQLFPNSTSELIHAVLY